MNNQNIIKAAILVIGILLGILAGQAYTNSSDNQEEIRLLFQQSAGAGTYSADDEQSVLNLTDVSPETTSFSDRPYRFADVGETKDFIGHWNASEAAGDSFETDPPNASITFVANETQGSAVIELKNPNYDESNNTLSYDVEILQGELPDAFNNVALFIDSKHTGPRFEIKNDTKHAREFDVTWASMTVTKKKIKAGKIGILPVGWACYDVQTEPADSQSSTYDAILNQCLPGNNPIKLKYFIQRSYDRNGPTIDGYFEHRK